MDWERARDEIETGVSRVIAKGDHLEPFVTWGGTSGAIKARIPGTGEDLFTVHVGLQDGLVLAGIVRKGEELLNGKPWSARERSFRDDAAKGMPHGLLNAIDKEVATYARSIRDRADAEASARSLGAAIQELAERSPDAVGGAVAGLLRDMLGAAQLDRLRSGVEALAAEAAPRP